MEIVIAPALLASDQARFGEGTERAGRSGADCARAGADNFATGTSLFGAFDLKSAVAQLRRSARAASLR